MNTNISMLVDAEPVKTDKQKKQQFLDLLDEEISVLTATGEDGAEGSNNLRSEVSSRFLKDLNFKLSEDKEKGTVTLTRTIGSGALAKVYVFHCCFIFVLFV
jgi:hypothetical protein